MAKKTKKEDIVEETKVSDHSLVPKHEIMNEVDKKQVLTQFNATEEQFPFLFSLPPW